MYVIRKIKQTVWFFRSREDERGRPEEIRLGKHNGICIKFLHKYAYAYFARNANLKKYRIDFRYFGGYFRQFANYNKVQVAWAMQNPLKDTEFRVGVL